MKKILCTCGCGQRVAPSTERAHRRGEGQPHIRAANAARLNLVPDVRWPLSPNLENERPSKRARAANTAHHEDPNSPQDIIPESHSPAPDHFSHGSESYPSPLPAEQVPPAVSQAASSYRGQIPTVRLQRERPRVYVEDSSDEERSEDRDQDSGDESSGSSDEEDKFDPWEGPRAAFEQELAEFGVCITISFFFYGSNWSFIEEDLTDDDLACLRHFALKVDTHMTEKTFAKLKYAFPESHVASLKITQSRAAFLAAYKPRQYHCCVNSCCAFLGPHADETHCPYCKEPRFDSQRQPRKKYTYSPIIPRLVALFQNPEYREKMQYRAEHQSDPNTMTNIFDSADYLRLKTEHVTVEGRPQPHKFFADERDIALGYSTDGFAPFRRRKNTCWPLLLFNYNLPPDIRFHLKYALCIAVIPGPKKPKDFDSFQWPLIEELMQLELGVETFDSRSSEMFPLRAFLIRIFGDIPAISMVMRMKGHNGLLPCRMCNIKGLRVPNSRATTHYVPLDRSRHPDVRHNPAAVRTYDALALPLRTHEQILSQGREVDCAATNAEAERLSKKYGVKGVPLLSHLSAITFPTSFPYDFMHLIYENLIKNLVLLWTGQFKGLDEGSGEYELNPGVWEAIGAATAASGKTVPGVFGARPRNVADDKTTCTADMWSFWLLYIGPVLLAKRFRRRAYYDHFVNLVILINICLQFEITREEISFLRHGFKEWVEKYEE